MADIMAPVTREEKALRKGFCPDCGAQRWQRSESKAAITCEPCGAVFSVELPDLSHEKDRK